MGGCSPKLLFKGIYEFQPHGLGSCKLQYEVRRSEREGVTLWQELALQYYRDYIE